ncbi:MAG: hypothetical protein PHH08_03165 [Candidatus ainarchaeum sp.]|nr:hypothetical protein [Candidatus ainarchaeum sp.]
MSRVTGKSDVGEAVEYLKELGLAGVLVHGGIKAAARLGHIESKRREVLKTVRLLTNAKAKRFRSLVFAVGRYLYHNRMAEGTALYDKRAEHSVYSLFGELAQKSSEYKRLFDLENSPAANGQNYFRFVIRNEMILNFNFLKENYSPEKMQALRYCLVGDKVDELTEHQDLERLKFVSSIFGEAGEVATIDRFLHNPRQHERAIRALISMQYKARFLDIKERDSFFRRACKYYGISQEEVYGVAKAIYHDPNIQGKRGRLLSAEDRQLLETARQAQAVYDFQPRTASPARERPKQKGPRIVLTPGALFEIEHGRRVKGPRVS